MSKDYNLPNELARVLAAWIERWGSQIPHGAGNEMESIVLDLSEMKVECKSDRTSIIGKTDEFNWNSSHTLD